MRRGGVRLPGLEATNDAVGMRGHVHSKKLHEDIVAREQLDQLSSLGFVQLAAFDFNRIVRPAVAQAQECLEEVILDRTGDNQSQNERVKRLPVRWNYEVTRLIDINSH